MRYFPGAFLAYFKVRPSARGRATSGGALAPEPPCATVTSAFGAYFKLIFSKDCAYREIGPLQCIWKVTLEDGVHIGLAKMRD